MESPISSLQIMETLISRLGYIGLVSLRKTARAMARGYHETLVEGLESEIKRRRGVAENAAREWREEEMRSRTVLSRAESKVKQFEDEMEVAKLQWDLVERSVVQSGGDLQWVDRFVLGLCFLLLVVVVIGVRVLRLRPYFEYWAYYHENEANLAVLGLLFFGFVASFVPCFTVVFGVGRRQRRRMLVVCSERQLLLAENLKALGLEIDQCQSLAAQKFSSVSASLKGAEESVSVAEKNLHSLKALRLGFSD